MRKMDAEAVDRIIAAVLEPTNRIYQREIKHMDRTYICCVSYWDPTNERLLYFQLTRLSDLALLITEVLPHPMPERRYPERSPRS